jgi:hypothetical protein
MNYGHFWIFRLAHEFWTALLFIIDSGSIAYSLSDEDILDQNSLYRIK